MSDYAIRLMYREDVPAATEFFASVYAPGHVMTDPAHVTWQFLNHPHADGKRTSLLLTQQNWIVGFLGIIPQHMRLAGEIVDVGWCANLIVAPDVRGHAGGALLLREAHAQWSALATTGYNTQSEPLLRGLGWQLQPALTRWVCNAVRAGDDETVPVKRFSADWDATWETLQKRYGVTTDRDHAFLNWRFIDHPRNEYVVRTTADGDGYVVVRIERAPEMVGARIVDMIGSPSAIPKLLAGAVNVAAGVGATFVDFFTSSVNDDGALVASHFVRADTMLEPPPAFLLPVDRRRSDITFAYWGQGAGNDPWYVVKADGDKDRAPGLI